MIRRAGPRGPRDPTALADAAGIERLPSDDENWIVRDDAGRDVAPAHLPADFVEAVEIENEYGAEDDQRLVEASLQALERMSQR